MNDSKDKQESVDAPEAAESSASAAETAASAAAAAAAPAPGKPSAPLSSGSGAPAWVVPVYFAGLVLVFAGQRALSALESGATMLTLAGAVLVLMATLVRFSPKFGAGGERGNIELLMRITSLVGLVALAVYGVTTEWGQERFGIAAQELQSRERTLALLRVVWLVLLLVALVPMAFAEASQRPMRHAERPESRRVRAAAAAGLTLALALGYSALFVFAAHTADIKVDYSYFKTSGPGEATKKMAASLEDQVQVTAFFPEVNEVKSEVEGYLKELSRAAPKLKVQMTDRLLEPKKARDLRATQDGTIVLSKGKVTRSVVVGTELDSARAKLKTLDRDLQAQLLKLARARRTVYMTVGHGELNDKGGNPAEGRSAQIVEELLRRQNYTVKELGLGQGLGNQLPDDADVVMVLGPTEPFAPEEEATLKRWVDAGGKLLLALDPDAVSGTDLVRVPGSTEGLAQPAPAGSVPAGASAAPAPPAAPAAPSASAPGSMAAMAQAAAAARPSESANPLGFGNLLGALGLKYSATVLANENKHVRRRYNDSDRIMLVTSGFSSHASVSSLSRAATSFVIVASGAGSLDNAEKSASPNNKIDFAIRTEPDTFADADRNFSRDKNTEPAKAYNLAAAISKKLDGKPAKKKPEAPKKPNPHGGDADNEKDPLDDLDETRAFVISDADALSDLVLSNVQGNQLMLVDAVRWLGGEESWAGQQTTEEDVTIEHTKKEDQVWFYSTIFGAPALVLGAGLFVSRRARQRHDRGAKR